MTPERWQQVREVLHGALQLAPEQRAAFLDKACPADDLLRRDVESLLSSDEACSSFLKSSALRIMISKGTRLGDYEVQSLLGSGGMGEVYRARDLRLHRDVAIKVLPALLSSDPNRLRRFEQEARAAAALNHPNILAVFQMGTFEGAPYLVSELLEGLTLREQIRRETLALAKVIEYGVQILGGLDSAHAKGIVHRDLKPENLFVTKEGQVKILDFGLAKLAQPARASATATTHTFDQKTDIGVVMGTMGYMSPEQARGEALDVRTDLFSVGVVLYEMTTSKNPFAGPTPAVIFNSILALTPAPPSQLREDLPPALERIICKALEKDRHTRYQTAAEIRSDLMQLQRRLESGTAKNATLVSAHRGGKNRVVWVGSVLALAIIASAVGRFLGRPKAQSHLWRQTTVAVLPFQNAAHDANLDYLGTALPDEVITTLSYAPLLSVRPFSMSQRFTGQNSDPHQAGQELRVANVVTGHFLHYQDRLGVTLEAVNIARDEVVWRSLVEVDSKDILRLREEMTSTLQKGLLPVLGASGGELSATKPKSQEAYELYLRSQDSTYWNIAGNKNGIALLERSLALDPGYAPSWLALGAHYYNDADMVTGNQEMFRKCIAAFERAHALDPNLLSASTWLIGTRRVYGNLAVSFAQVQELAQQRPRRAEVHVLLAQLLRSAGALEQAARECEITHRLDPDLWTDCFVLYIYMGDLAKARREIDRSPGEFSSFILGHVLLREGKIDEALPRLKILPTANNYELIHSCLPNSSTSECVATSKRIKDSFLSLPDPDAWYFGAALFAFLGKEDDAIRLLEADAKHSFCVYPAIDHDPLFDKIRQSAQFKAARQRGIECQKRFSPYANIQIQ